MQPIKNLIAYKAHLPENTFDLNEHLEEKAYQPPSLSDTMSAGFVPPRDGDTVLLAEIQGGLAFAMRIDTKTVPSSAVDENLRKRLDQIERTTGRRPGKKERKELKQEVIDTLMTVALPRTVIVPIYYQAEGKHLLVCTSNRKHADLITSMMVQAIGSMKTETIHVSEVKHGLTTRLKNWLAAEGSVEALNAFDDFEPVNTVELSQGKDKLSVAMGALGAADDGLNQAMQRGLGVHSIGLRALQQGTAVTFRLAHDFTIKGVQFPKELGTDVECEDAAAWMAGMQMQLVSGVLDRLCIMFAYKPPGGEEGVEAEEEAEA